MLAHKLTGLFVVAAILLQGCTGPVRKDAVPESLTADAQVPGLTDVRFRIGVDNDAFAREGIESVRREQAYLKARKHRGPLPPSVILAISGGGDNGAFGAGLLNGWSAAGDRPTFKLVTGVSTGALIAPFAFLGPKYDAALKDFYTNISPMSPPASTRRTRRNSTPSLCVRCSSAAMIWRQAAILGRRFPRATTASMVALKA